MAKPDRRPTSFGPGWYWVLVWDIKRNCCSSLLEQAMIKICLFSALMAVTASSSCNAAGQIPYGSGAGMAVTVTNMDGINSDRATISVLHTRENAKEYCTRYRGDPSDYCVEAALKEVRISNFLRGNCRTGEFVNLKGESLQFVGSNVDHDAVPFSPDYRIFMKNASAFLDGSVASQYLVNLEQFRELCPESFRQAEMEFQRRPRYIGRWYEQEQTVCRREEGSTQGLLVYKAGQATALEGSCPLKLNLTDDKRYDLTLTCQRDGVRRTRRELLLVTGNRLERTVIEGPKSYKSSYTRCPP